MHPGKMMYIVFSVHLDSLLFTVFINKCIKHTHYICNIKSNKILVRSQTL